MARLPWGHKSRHCVECGQVGPRVQVGSGWAHRRCIRKDAKPHKPKAGECCRGGPLWSNCVGCTDKVAAV